MKRLAVVMCAVMLVAGSVSGCGKSGSGPSLGGLDLTSQLTSLLGQASGALSGISSIESAQSALPALETVDMDLGRLATKAGDASPEVQKQLSEVASSSLPDIQALASQVSSIPGVSGVLGSTLSSITGKLSGLI